MSAVIRLNHYLTELPSENARSLDWWRKFYSTVEKIAWVALVAITAFVLISSIGAPAVTGAVSLAMVALSFSILFFAWGAMLFRDYSQKAEAQAAVENKVAEKLASLPDDLKIPAEAKIDTAQTTLCERKRVFARIQHLEEQTQKIKERAFAALEGSRQPPLNQIDRQVKFMAREVNAYDLEYRAYPMLFEAALLWKVLQDPTKEQSIEQHGSFVQKSHGRRLSDKEYLKEDRYFVFHDEKKDPITFASLKDESSFTLAQKLFA